MTTVNIKYVGKKEQERDHLYGSGQIWNQGESHPVAAAVASKLLQHPEFIKDDGQAPQPSLPEEPVEPVSKPPSEEEAEFPPMVNIPTMSKAQLVEYAMREYGVDLDPKMKADQLRSAVNQLGEEKLHNDGVRRIQDAETSE